MTERQPKMWQQQHAIHFLERYRQQIREIGEVGFDPIIVAPFDAELFGHWWFEGPISLEEFIRYAAKRTKFPAHDAE